MVLISVDLVRFEPLEGSDTCERCVIDTKIVRTLLASGYDHIDDFRILFRDISEVEFLHCDTEVEVVMAKGYRDTLMATIIEELRRAQIYTVEGCFLTA